MEELFIGLMSGTSMDAIDAVLVDFSRPTPQLLATHQQAIPKPLRITLNELCQPGTNEIQRLGELDVQVGKLFALASNMLLEKGAIARHKIRAIGSHGQTIRHYPHGEYRFTLQIGDPNIIAEETGITTIADFRRRDMAKGGQGAPLVPAFHHYLFHDSQTDKVIVNIGGIANITILNADNSRPITGFDTGPGNTLLDNWILQQLAKEYDHNGDWAAQGQCNIKLLDRLLSDPYFSLAPPKSTGREYFNLIWLQKHLAASYTQFSAVDIQTTLLELTAVSISQAIQCHAVAAKEILICGGGAYNQQLLQRLRALLQTKHVTSTATIGINPEWIEAMAFAWLARQTLNGKPGNLPSVTGANGQTILGGIYLAK